VVAIEEVFKLYSKRNSLLSSPYRYSLVDAQTWLPDTAGDDNREQAARNLTLWITWGLCGVSTPSFHVASAAAYYFDSSASSIS
jgi:hypothetical protein